MPDTDPRLNLLLADADERSPVLGEGLPAEASHHAPKPAKTGARHDSFLRRRKDADPNDLRLQRWALVAPEGREGDRMLEAIEPLRRLREDEQGAPVTVHRVRGDMSPREHRAWREDVYSAEDIPEEERAHYLLCLGDLRHVPLDLQQTLASVALVGRVHFGDAAGEIDPTRYEAYAKKVVRHAREGTPERAADLLFHVAADGTRATAEADARLVTPGFEAAQDSHSRSKLPAASVRRLEAETASALLSEGASGRPAVLLSVSHGVGAPRGGWRSGERMWREQGALVIGEGDVLDAERLSGQTFLPGGLWFCLACFGAGTPRDSAYEKWLRLLAEEQSYRGKVESVRASLPSPEQHPFVAALPQAALASPGGPLAVIGHVDLAWTYGFSSATNPSDSKKSRVLSTLEIMVRGGRAGVALDRLVDVYREVNDSLMSTYEEEEAARREGKPDSVDRRERGHLWMTRNDLRGYVLLGDPAVRLPLAGHAVADRTSAPVEIRSRDPGPPLRAPDPPFSPDPSDALDAPRPSAEVPVEDKVAAVHALLRGAETPLAIAARAGVSLDELWAWFDAYRAAGREALDHGRG